jgi:hypothetical protein
MGGQALATMANFVYTDVKTTPGRVFGTTYYNTSSKVKKVSVYATATAAAMSMNGIVNGVAVVWGPNGGNTTNQAVGVQVDVPPSGSYSVIVSSGTGTLNNWFESI